MEFLAELVKRKVDVLLISEIKIDESFPLGQFNVNGFNTPFRVVRDSSGGGIMLFVRKDISAELIGSKKSPIEGFFAEINLRKQKWLITCSYNLNKSMIVQHEEALSKIMGLHLSTYENFIFLGNFNAGMEHVVLKDFFNFYSLTNLSNKHTCQILQSRIDLILTYRPKYF